VCSLTHMRVGFRSFYHGFPKDAAGWSPIQGGGEEEENLKRKRGGEKGTRPDHGGVLLTPFKKIETTPQMR